MLRAAFLVYALILPSLFALAFAGQLALLAENVVAENAQIALGHHDDHRVVCHGISRSISPASQVFYPGTMSALFSELLPITHVDPQILPNSRKTSLIGPTRPHRYPRAPCGQAQ